MGVSWSGRGLDRKAGQTRRNSPPGAGRPVVRRTVTIAAMRQIAMINFELLFEFELTVLPDGMPPYPATTQQLVSQQDVRRLVPGVILEATVEASNPAAIQLDLGSLRC